MLQDTLRWQHSQLAHQESQDALGDRRRDDLNHACRPAAEANFIDYEAEPEASNIDLFWDFSLLVNEPGG
jgi:hypothetical protein